MRASTQEAQEENGATAGAEPTVLLVAAGERLAPALAERLAHHGVQVEVATPGAVATTALVSAPDVVVLAGEAALDGGEEVLSALARVSATASVPVILVADEASAGVKLGAFRHGVVAVIDRSASADDMARRIAEVARELPERTGETAGPLETATLDEVVALFAQSLRSGILAVTGERGGPSAQVVLRPDRPLTDAIGELVAQLKPMIARGGTAPLTYEFHEAAPARISSIDLGDEHEHEHELASLRGVRILVIQANAARADLLAQELRVAGALVAVADGAGAGLELAHELAPEVVVLDGAGVDSWALDALRAIRRDPSLRWASLLVLDDARLWSNARRPNVALLAKKTHALLEPDRDLEARARAEASFSTRLDVVGPIRLLRALARTELGLDISFQNPRLHVHVDVADGLVAGATARKPAASKPVAEGPAALASLLGLASGRVQIVRAQAPRATNVMAPIDAALAAASREASVVAPSLPPPSLGPSSRGDARPAIPGPPKVPLPAPSTPGESATRSVRPAIPGELGGGDLPALVGRLEKLLSDLKDVETDGPADAAGAAPAPPRAPPMPPPAVPAARAPRADDPGEDEHTGTYSDAVMAQLRQRMRRSSANMRAVGGGATRGKAPGSGAHEPATAGATPSARAEVKPAATAAGARVPGPSAPARPTSKTMTLGAVSAPAPVAPPTAAVTPPGAARARRKETLVGIPSPVQPPAPSTSPSIALPKASVTEEAATQVEIHIDALGGEPEPATSPDATAPAPARGGAGTTARHGSIAPAPSAPPPDAPREPAAFAPHAPQPPPAPPAPQPPGPAAATLARPAPPLAPVHPAPPPAPIATFAPPAPAAPAAVAFVASVASPPLAPLPPSVSSTADEVPSVHSGPRSAAPAAPTVRARGTPRWKIAALGLATIVLAFAAGFGLVLLRGGTTDDTTGGASPAAGAPGSAPTTPVAAGGPPTTPGAVPATPPPPGPGPTAPSVAPPGAGVAPGGPPGGAAATATAGPSAPPAEATPPLAAAPGLRLPLGPDDPVEGVEADFDLARLGVTPVSPPASRRALQRRVRDLLRDAQRYRARGALADAEDAYRRILALDGAHPRATAGLALIALERGEGTTALVFAQRLTRLRSEYASNFVLLGDAYRAAGDPGAARRAWARALDIDPRHAGARERIASLR